MERIKLISEKMIKVSCIVVLFVVSLTANAQKLSSDIKYYKDDSVTNQIPYFDNRFRIDAQLEEVTLIFYHRNGAQPVILVRPDGTKLKISNTPSDNIQWFDDSTYDMIKIKSPMVGPWQVIGDVEPSSKIMVVSEIRLEVTPLPKVILQGETLKVEGRLFNGNKAIDDPLFSKVLELDVDFFSTNNSKFDNFGAKPVKLTSFRDDGRDLDEYANDSLFTGEFILNFAPGEWEPIYIIKMPMATRKLKQPPVIVEKNPISTSVLTTQDENSNHVITFSIDDSFIKIDSILIQGKVIFPDKNEKAFTIVKGQGVSRTYNISYNGPGVHRVKVDVFGNTINGREFRSTIKEFSFNVNDSNDASLQPIDDTEISDEQKKAQVIVNAAAAADKLVQELAQEKVRQQEELADKQQETILYIVLGNTTVVLIAGLLFFFMRNKKTKK